MATIENVNQSSIKAGVKHPCGTIFLSHATEKLVRLMPSFRGATMLGSTLMRCIPFLDKRAFLTFESAKCQLDLRYKTQFGFAVRPYESYESLLVLRLLNKSVGKELIRLEIIKPVLISVSIILLIFA